MKIQKMTQRLDHAMPPTAVNAKKSKISTFTARLDHTVPDPV